MTAPDSLHYLVVAAGSAGDMYPFLSLAKALQRLGRDVGFMGPCIHAGMVEGMGLPFISVGRDEDFERIFADEDLWHPVKGFEVLFRDYRASLAAGHRAFESLPPLPPGHARVVLCHPALLPVAALSRDLAGRRNGGTRIVGLYLAPSNVRTRHDPLTIGPLKMPSWVPLSWRGALWRWLDARYIDPLTLPDLNAQRAALKLPPVQGFIPHVHDVPDLSVTLFPDWFGAPCPDWPAPLCTGDFQLFDPREGEHLSPELVAFLGRHRRPVVFTPGTGHRHAARFFAQALEAVRQLGLPALFLTSHREQVPAQLPEQVLWQPYVPMRHLLPLAGALVYHGGIGTLAESLRAGVPQLVTPFAWDQFDNGARIEALGVGRCLPASRLSAGKLVDALSALLSSDETRLRCTEVAGRFSRARRPESLVIEIESRLGLGRDPVVASAAQPQVGSVVA